MVGTVKLPSWIKRDANPLDSVGMSHPKALGSWLSLRKQEFEVLQSVNSGPVRGAWNVFQNSPHVSYTTFHTVIFLTHFCQEVSLGSNGAQSS